MVPTIDSVCRAYIAQVKNYRKPSTGRATRTWRTVQSDLKHLRSMPAPPEPGNLFADASHLMNDLPATSLTPDVLAALLENLARPGTISRHTINRLRATIIRMYNWSRRPERTWCRNEAGRKAMKDTWRELRDVEPLKRGRTPAKESVRVVAADHIDVWQTIQEADAEAAAGDHRMADLRDLVRVMWESGMRPNEACQLSLSSIDRTREPWLFVPTEHKTEHHGKRRTIYLGKKTRRVLEQRIAAVKAEGRDWLFEQRTRVSPSKGGGKPTGKPVRVNRMGQLLSELHSRHALPHFTLNQLRHAAATRIARSQDIHAASSVLGHSSIKTTEIYIDPDDEGLRRTAEEHC